MTIKLYPLLILSILLNYCNHEPESSPRQKLLLGGDWRFALDSTGSGIDEKWYERTLPEVVKLPGTLDENDKGIPNINTLETMRLSRERTYEGFAWYRKEITIPPEWERRCIRLIMERTKPSTVWIDSVRAGSDNSILTPQVYDLSAFLTPGNHTITILIDNGQG